MWVPWDSIRPNPDQPRQWFDPADLRRLAASIKEDGQHEVVRVRPVKDDPKHQFQIVNGERRWRACRIARVEKVLAWVAEAGDEEQEFELSLLANNSSKPLTPMETARGIKRLHDSRRLSHIPLTERVRRIAIMFERTDVWVYQQLSLLKLVPHVQKMLEPSSPNGQRLGVTIGIALASLPESRQLEAAQYIAKKGMIGNQARAYIEKIAAEEGIGSIGVGRCGRPPIGEFRKFQTFVWSSVRDAELFASLSQPQFQEIFGRRSAAELDEMLLQLRRAEENIRRVCGSLEVFYRRAVA